jgi:hypothetical protein
LNGINAIRLDVNTTRYDAAGSRKRIIPVGESKTATETDKKKQFKAELDNSFNSNQDQSNTQSELILSDRKYYRTHLLSKIYEKMSGVEPRFHSGHFVEYYA